MLYRGLDRSSRLVVVLTVSFISMIAVNVTGGILSPVKVLLFLPVYLGSLYFGLTGGLLASLVCCFYGMVLYQFNGSTLFTPTMALSQAVAFLLTALVVGLFTDRLLLSTRQAVDRAEQQETRAHRPNGSLILP